ncbi:MAG: enoyl-CoA hydratase/isomerase family protein [Rickettsia africae]
MLLACGLGVALGGGYELLLHSSFIIGNQELNAGLVERGVGLIPGWGGVLPKCLLEVMVIKLN